MTEHVYDWSGGTNGVTVTPANSGADSTEIDGDSILRYSNAYTYGGNLSVLHDATGTGGDCNFVKELQGRHIEAGFAMLMEGDTPTTAEFFQIRDAADFEICEVMHRANRQIRINGLTSPNTQSNVLPLNAPYRIEVTFNTTGAAVEGWNGTAFVANGVADNTAQVRVFFDDMDTEPIEAINVAINDLEALYYRVGNRSGQGHKFWILKAKLNNDGIRTGPLLATSTTETVTTTFDFIALESSTLTTSFDFVAQALQGDVNATFDFIAALIANAISTSIDFSAAASFSGVGFDFVASTSLASTTLFCTFDFATGDIQGVRTATFDFVAVPEHTIQTAFDFLAITEDANVQTFFDFIAVFAPMVTTTFDFIATYGLSVDFHVGGVMHKWEISGPNYLSMPSITREVILAYVRALENGVPIDPTSFVVYGAIKAVDADGRPTEPEEEDWVEQEWETDSSTSEEIYFIKCLVGTDTSLPIANGDYHLWVRIAANTEAPVRILTRIHAT